MLYNTRSEAYQRELAIKKWKSRKRIVELVGSAHSGFQDGGNEVHQRGGMNKQEAASKCIGTASW